MKFLENRPITLSFKDTIIRGVVLDSMTWLTGVDVCRAIGYSRSTSALRGHNLKPAVFYPFETNGGIQKLRILDIEDVVRLIAARNSKRSFLFKEWLYEKSLLKKEIIKEGQLAGNGTAAEAIDLLKDIMTRCGFAPVIIELVKTYLATLRIDNFMAKTKEKQAGDFLKKNSPLSDEEINIINENKNLPVTQIVPLVGRSPITIYRYRKLLSKGALILSDIPQKFRGCPISMSFQIFLHKNSKLRSKRLLFCIYTHKK